MYYVEASKFVLKADDSMNEWILHATKERTLQLTSGKSIHRNFAPPKETDLNENECKNGMEEKCTKLKETVCICIYCIVDFLIDSLK